MIIRDLEQMYDFIPEQASNGGTRFKMVETPLFAFIYSEKLKTVSYLFRVEMSTHCRDNNHTLVFNNALRGRSNEYTPYIKANGETINKSDWGFEVDSVGVYTRSKNPNSLAAEKIYFGTDVADARTIHEIVNNNTIICEEVEI